MKTIMKIALILSALAFAVVANAQAPSATTNSGSSTSPVPATSQDAAQIDFVTVGATMPYATSFAAADFDTWRSNAAVLGFNIPTTGPGAVTNTKVWSARRLTPPPVASDSTVFGGFTGDSSQIFVTWPETGAFRLSFSNTVNVDGVTPSPDCASAVSSRTVYVLPAPNVTGTVTGHEQVLTCGDNLSHTISFNVRGIGLRQASFIVTRQAISGVATPTSILTSGTAGAAQTSDDFFIGSTAFSDASNFYTSGAGETISITVNYLQPGYVYRVDITGVSDQISRKSFTGQAAFIAPESPVFATFAVIPTPTATPIDFVGNQETINTASEDPPTGTPIFP